MMFTSLDCDSSSRCSSASPAGVYSLGHTQDFADMADSPAPFVPTVTAISSCPDLQWMVQSVVSSVAPSTGRAHPYSPNTSTSFSRARTQGDKAHSSSRRGRIEQVDVVLLLCTASLLMLHAVPERGSTKLLSLSLPACSRGGGEEEAPPRAEQDGRSQVPQQEARAHGHPSSRNRLAGGREVRPAERHRQPAQREGAAGVHPGRPPPHLQDPGRDGRRRLLPRPFHAQARLPDPEHGDLRSFQTDRHDFDDHHHLVLLSVLRPVCRPPDLHREDLRPRPVPGGLPGAPDQGRAGHGALRAGRGPVQLAVRPGLGAPVHAGQPGPGAPLHARGHLHARLHHLHIFLRLLVPGRRRLPHLRPGPPRQRQQRAVIRFPQLPHAADLMNSAGTVQNGGVRISDLNDLAP